MTAGRAKTVTSVNVDQLATLLKWTAGEVHDNGVVRRLAPTGGNLGSVDLWVVARHIAGLRQGIYHYHAPRHALEYARPLPAGAGPVALALGESGPHLPDLVVGTGALAKCAQKYGAFAYRLIYLDSGVALAYLHTVAAALGIGLHEYADYDEVAMAHLLGIPTRWEFPLPTFAVGLCSPDETVARAPAVVPVSPGGQPAGSHRGLTPSDYSDEILAHLLEAVAASPAPPVTMPEMPRQIPRCQIPVVTDALEHVLLSRRAMRDYRSLDIPGPVLQALAAITAQVLENRLAATGHRCCVRPLLAVARTSEPLEPGLYEMALSSGALHKRAPFSPARMRDCTNQEALAMSPAAFFMVGDIGAAVERCGPRAYRMLVQHAGAAVGQAWLAATAFGLGGTAAGGIIAGGLQRAAALDGYRECPLLAFHMGYSQAGVQEGQFV
jgi:SagB-type dehydrogenase family enzyme